MTIHNDFPDHDDQLEAEATAEESRRLERAVEQSDIQWLMGTKQGRRLMWRLLAKAGVYRTSFVAPNAMQVSFLEGRRGIGLEWLDEIMENCPEQFNAMMTEQYANAKRTSSSPSSGNTKSR